MKSNIASKKGKVKTNPLIDDMLLDEETMLDSEEEETKENGSTVPAQIL